MPTDREREIVLKHVLCAVDLSSSSIPALSRAIELANVYGARLDVLHVLDAATTATEFLKSRRDDLLVHLRQMAEGLVDRQRSFNASVAQGEPTSEILSYAHKHRPDLLVIGSCSSRRPRPFVVVGQTARTLISGATCPVLVVPEASATARGNAPTTVRHIVCALSSGASRWTLKHAVSFALKFGARLTILHVVEHDHNRSQADSELRELCRSIPDSVRGSWRIDELGAVADEIIDVTRVLSADLLVLGFRRDFLSEDTRDAIVSSVVRDIASDVLVVPGVAIVEPSFIGASGLEAGSGSPPS